MPVYIMLLNYTAQGHKNIHEAPKRTDSARESFKAFGANLVECYAVMGQYDEIAIVEAQNDEVASRAAHHLCSQGNVRVQTLRAHTQDEHKKILAGLR